jgi:dipeptidyl aminopeptidase/acylaminoacyl peptidase
LVPEAAVAGPGAAPVSERVRETTGDERTALLSDSVTAIMAQVTGLSAEQVLSGQAVSMDSLMAVELNMHLKRELGLSVSPVRLQQNLSVSALVEALADELDQDEPALRTGSPVVHHLMSADGLAVHGHLSLPAGAGPHPVVVVCTADQAGALDADGRYARVREHTPLVKAGFAVFTVDQRGALGHGDELAAKTDFGGRDIDDVLAAAGYLAGLPEIDAARMSIFGTSRGAYAALLAVARAPELWQRAVLLMGFYDPLRYLAEERAVRSDSSPLLRYAPVTPDRLEALLAEKSRRPLGLLSPDIPPLYVLHGDADQLVLPGHSAELVSRAREMGIQVEAVTVPGLGHDIEHTHHAWPGLWAEITTFLS